MPTKSLKSNIDILSTKLDRSKVPVKEPKVDARVLGSLLQRVNKAHDDLTALVKTLNTVAQPTVSATDLSAHAEKLLRGMKALTKVKDVELTNSYIIVTTLPLKAKYHNKDLALGRFTIHIPYLRGEIVFKNLDKRKVGLDTYDSEAPRVNSSGYACFGEISSSVHNLLAAQMYVELVAVLIRFLESINTEDTVATSVADDLCSVEQWNKKKGVVKIPV